jgi:hypothetical protein
MAEMISQMSSFTSGKVTSLAIKTNPNVGDLCMFQSDVGLATGMQSFVAPMVKSES